MQAFSYKVRDCAATDLQNRLLVWRTRDSTGTRAHLSSSQRLPAELAVRPTFAGRPLGTASMDASLAAPKALQLSTRRGTARSLCLASDFDPGRYPRFLVALRTAISGFCGRRGRWTDRGPEFGRMVACGRMSIRSDIDVGWHIARAMSFWGVACA